MKMNTPPPGKFPGPSVNDCKLDDPMIERVDFDKTTHGANKASLPSSGDVKNSTMNLEHVGGSAMGKG
jgi:hypothetical protein